MFYVKNIANIYTAFNIVKLTKNVPKVLNCKTNHNFFLTNMGFPNWGGVPTWEKFSHCPVFFPAVMSLIPDLIRVSDTVSQIPLYSPLYSPQLHLTAHLRNVQLDATKSSSPTKATAT